MSRFSGSNRSRDRGRAIAAGAEAPPWPVVVAGAPLLDILARLIALHVDGFLSGDAELYELVCPLLASIRAQQPALFATMFGTSAESGVTVGDLLAGDGDLLLGHPIRRLDDIAHEHLEVHEVGVVDDLLADLFGEVDE